MSALTPVYTVGDQIVGHPGAPPGGEQRPPPVAGRSSCWSRSASTSPQQRARAFPARTVRRRAPAGRDRHRYRQRPRPHHLRRADHRPWTSPFRPRSSRWLKTARDVTNAGVLIITHDLGWSPSSPTGRWSCTPAARLRRPASTISAHRSPDALTPQGFWGRSPLRCAARRLVLIRCPAVGSARAAVRPACLAIDDRSIAGAGAGCVDGNLGPGMVAGRSAADIYGVAVETGRQRRRRRRAPVVGPRPRPVPTYRLTKGAWCSRPDRRRTRAVDNVSFGSGRATLGIVGESGSREVHDAHEILEPRAPQSVHRGKARQRRRDAHRSAAANLRGDLERCSRIRRVPADPRMPVFDLLAEPLQANGSTRRPPTPGRGCWKSSGFAAVRTPAAIRASSPWPETADRHVSGAGLTTEDPGPSTSRAGPALDVLLIQAGIINLLLDLQRESLSYLCPARLVGGQAPAHTVAVMYRGAIVEYGDSEQVFANPQNEYTPGACWPRSHSRDPPAVGHLQM